MRIGGISLTNAFSAIRGALYYAVAQKAPETVGAFSTSRNDEQQPGNNPFWDITALNNQNSSRNLSGLEQLALLPTS